VIAGISLVLMVLLLLVLISFEATKALIELLTGGPIRRNLILLLSGVLCLAGTLSRTDAAEDQAKAN